MKVLYSQNLMILSTLIYLLLLSCQSNRSDQEALVNISYTPKGQLQTGSIDSTTYRNAYFDITLSLDTQQWELLDENLYQQRLMANKEALSPPDSIWEKSTQNMTNLLTIERLTTTSATSISFIAEGIENTNDFSSALEYLTYTRRYCQENYSFGYPKYTVTGLGKDLIGSRMFLFGDMTIEDSPGDVRFQRTYSAQFDEYLLNILVNYTLETELLQIQEILREVKWGIHKTQPHP